MTRVIFYINVAAQARFLRRFLHNKVFKPRQTALIYGDEAALQETERELWMEFFLPHQRLEIAESAEGAEGAGDAEGAESAGDRGGAPILLTSEMPPPQHQSDILISLAAEVPTAFAGRFPAFVDIVGVAEAEKAAGRERFRYFKEHGYPLEVVDMKGK